MNLNEAVRTALTSGSPTFYVTQDTIPQGVNLGAVSLWVTFLIVSAGRGFHLRGFDGQLNSRVTVDTWSLTDTVAIAAMDECEQLMVASPLFNAIPIPFAGFEEREPDTGIYRVSRDFSVTKPHG